MKKIFLAAITFSTIIVSCTSTTDEMTGLEAITPNASELITTYIANNFPDTKIVSSQTAKDTVTTELNTGEELKFSTAGVYIAYANNANWGLAADSLGITCDSTHTDSIRSGDHRGVKHGDKGGRGGKGGGKHNNESTNTGGRHGHDRHSENEIAIDSLAAGINTYISTNYSGYTVLHAETDTICEGVVTEVLVTLASAQPIKLVFDATNVYMFKAERIEYSSMPTVISTAVTANYSTYTIMKRSETYTSTDSSIKYKVYLKSSDTRKSVTFNADGTVSCEK
ncbi:MAG: hypothetical protein JZU53_14250 [Paludibacter sp.]|nr:hypothetical protein [Paludibacter sp.]